VITKRARIRRPRSIGGRRPSWPEREEREVAIRHVAVLRAVQKARHDRSIRVTVHDHCNAHHDQTDISRNAGRKTEIKQRNRVSEFLIGVALTLKQNAKTF